MEIIKFNNQNHPTRMEHAELVEGFTSKMWIERYREAGEFKFIAPVDSGIREKLPPGTYISHMDTPEIMIVENHEIDDKRGRKSDIVITGRGFESFMENRVAGSAMEYGAVASPEEFTLDSDRTWMQALTLIKKHVQAGHLIRENDEYPWVLVTTSVSDVPGSTIEERQIKPGPLYSSVMGLLEIDDLGIAVRRPTDNAAIPHTVLVIYNGSDKSDTVAFSYDSGEIDSAHYLWSIKGLKNSAFVKSKWFQARVETGAIKQDRRMLFVDAGDIDNEFSTLPVDAQRAEIRSKIVQRGRDEIAKHNLVVITQAELGPSVVTPAFRKDYSLGDIVAVHGRYDISANVRVSEYVEIEDENSAHGYPTFTFVSERRTYRQAILYDHPTGYWPLNEKDGEQAIDHTENGLHGVYTNVELGVSGITGDTAVRFGAPGSGIRIPYDVLINKNRFSHEAWVRATGGSGQYRTIIRAGELDSGYILRLTPTGTYQALVNTAQGMESITHGSVSLNAWEHLVHIFVGGVLYFYRNGILESRLEPSGYVQNLTKDTFIGTAGTVDRWIGDISDVAIYDYELTAEQIQNHLDAAPS